MRGLWNNLSSCFHISLWFITRWHQSEGFAPITPCWLAFIGITVWGIRCPQSACFFATSCADIFVWFSQIIPMNESCCFWFRDQRAHYRYHTQTHKLIFGGKSHNITIYNTSRQLNFRPVTVVLVCCFGRVQAKWRIHSWIVADAESWAFRFFLYQDSLSHRASKMYCLFSDDLLYASTSLKGLPP